MPVHLIKEDIIMAKTEKELKELKEKVEELNSELKELTEEELSRVSGGLLIPAKGEIKDGKMNVKHTEGRSGLVQIR